MSWADDRRRNEDWRQIDEARLRREVAVQEKRNAGMMERERESNRGAMDRAMFNKRFDANNMTAYQRAGNAITLLRDSFQRQLDARKFNEKRLADDRFTYKEFDENGIEQTRVGRYSDFEARAVSLAAKLRKTGDPGKAKKLFDTLPEQDRKLLRTRWEFEKGNIDIPGWGESPVAKANRPINDRSSPMGGMTQMPDGTWVNKASRSSPMGGMTQMPDGTWTNRAALQGSTSRSAVAAARNTMNVPQRVNPPPAIARTPRSMFDASTSMPVPAAPSDSGGISLSDKPLFNRRIGSMFRFRPSQTPLLERTIWNSLEFAPPEKPQDSPSHFFSGRTNRSLLDTTLPSRRKNSRTQWYNRTLGDYFRTGGESSQQPVKKPTRKKRVPQSKQTAIDKLARKYLGERFRM